MNDDIRATEVRCNVDGEESLGVISIDEAMAKANELDLDLVLIAPDAKPPVAKIMDYVKHAREFLEKGFHVKFRVFLRGREMAHPEAGKEVLLRVWPMVEDLGVMEKPPKFEGRYFNINFTFNEYPYAAPS
ncbi:hypothetical protein P692DRAFT_20823955 [Suillus brevipes Sb2]|nr:hypothetical protein P692DRAFT_20823955 [Suillus brevipes Sb2]